MTRKTKSPDAKRKNFSFLNLFIKSGLFFISNNFDFNGLIEPHMIGNYIQTCLSILAIMWVS